MTRDHEEQLLAFSAAQRLRFREEDWVKHGYFTAAEFRQRAEAAASYLVGNIRRLQTTIDIVFKDTQDLERPPAPAPGSE